MSNSRSHGDPEYRQQRMKVYRKRWRKKNPDKKRAQVRRYRARQRGASGHGENVLIERIWERDRGTCHLCKAPVLHPRVFSGTPRKDGPSLDHVLPVADHGPHTYENIRLAHVGCNSSRGRNPICPKCNGTSEVKGEWCDNCWPWGTDLSQYGDDEVSGIGVVCESAISFGFR